ncbi:MAG: hypothetical protein KCHDKBKB_02430 [Elusimicrobia bacterium]|nr:hypothetical protein [Elusimicrobiota bacterium]
MKSVPKKVTTEFLLKGCLYALQQSGFLLEQAVCLFEKKYYSGCVVLSAFGREELGRSRIIEGLLKKNHTAPGSITTQNIVRLCDNHIEKQMHSQLSITMRGSKGSQISDLMQIMMKSKPGSSEYITADKNISEIREKLKHRKPNERHRARVLALYVDLDEKGNGWTMPCLTSRELAHEFLIDAINDYSLNMHRIVEKNVKAQDPILFNILDSWKQWPEFWKPLWPEP